MINKKVSSRIATLIHGHRTSFVNCIVSLSPNLSNNYVPLHVLDNPSINFAVWLHWENISHSWRLVIFYLKCAAYKSTYLLTYLLTYLPPVVNISTTDFMSVVMCVWFDNWLNRLLSTLLFDLSARKWWCYFGVWGRTHACCCKTKVSTSSVLDLRAQRRMDITFDPWHPYSNDNNYYTPNYRGSYIKIIENDIECL